MMIQISRSILKLSVSAALSFVAFSAVDSSAAEFTGILQYSAHEDSGAAPQMRLSVPFVYGPELKIDSPELLSLAITLNGSLVRVVGEVGSVAEAKEAAAEILTVTSIDPIALERTCVGSALEGGMYRDGEFTKAFVKKGDRLLDLLTCRVPEDQVVCTDESVYDSGFELRREFDTYRVFAVSLHGIKEVDTFECQ